MPRTNSPIANSTVVAVPYGDRAALLDFGLASTAQALRWWPQQHGVRQVP